MAAFQPCFLNILQTSSSTTLCPDAFLISCHFPFMLIMEGIVFQQRLRMHCCVLKSFRKPPAPADAARHNVSNN